MSFLRSPTRKLVIRDWVLMLEGDRGPDDVRLSG
jgi:hypothetical protein